MTRSATAWFSVLLGILLIGACGDGQDAFNHPESDALAALKKGDEALLGVYRYTLVVPGVAGDAAILRNKYKVRPIEGTSDTFSDDPNSFDARAQKYAAAYNAAIMNGLGCRVDHPMARCSRPAHQ